MAKGQRNCIFCGDVANSREHLWPDWLRSILPSDELAIHHREVGGIKTKWERKPFTEKTKIVCHACNTGWMCQLEEFAKPILTPAITRTGSCYFDLREQWIAARWAVKTCYVFQNLAPELLAPSIHPFLLRVNGKPPPQVSVFIGSHYRALKDPQNSVYLQKPVTLTFGDSNQSFPDSGYFSFLAVGGVSFLVVGHRFGSYLEVVAGEHTTRMVTKIWPWSSRLVHWPPETLLDQELVEPFFLQDSYPPGLDIRPFPDVISPDDGQGGVVRRAASPRSDVPT